MAVSSILRFISLLVVMLVVGLGRFKIASLRLKKQGAEEPETVSQAKEETKEEAKNEAKKQAKKFSLLAAFFYMAAMVSVAGLFM